MDEIDPSQTLTPKLLVAAYRQGIFPMAVPEDGDRIFWFSPDPRCILPLDVFHISHSLRRRLRQGVYEVSVDRDFSAVITACAEPRPDHADTWISPEIIRAYTALHKLGCAHSVEAWYDGRLVGGLYGVALGGAFFGESMFHRRQDASKVALVHLVERLRAGGFTLLDTQYETPHLARFGAVELPRAAYLRRLEAALTVDATWNG